MKKLLLLGFIIFVTFTPDIIQAQAINYQRNHNTVLPPDEENLNVFQDWIRWNNPGSLLINHLTKQAMDYYEIRDRKYRS